MATAYTSITSDHLDALLEIVGEANLSTSQVDLDLHAVDQSMHEPHPPEVVIFAQSAHMTADVLKYANENRIPVTPWGVGTSLEGNPIPICGGILLSFERMTDIIEVHSDDFQVTVQSGIGHKDLNAQLARYGLFFPPDPGANATIGGMLANNAAGIRTVRYGASKDNVLAMQVALADGRLIRVGSRSIKQSSGYNLMQLIVGSEGTLGIITEATLRLVPIPEFISAAVAGFESIEAAVETVVAVRGSGLQPAALEFIDAAHAKMLRDHGGADLPDSPVLFMEFHEASQAALDQGLAMLAEICEEMGVIHFKATSDNTERQKLWHARHASYEITIRTHPNTRFLLMDVAVPISAYPELIGFIEQIRVEHNVQLYLIGHAGDGNIHVEFPHTNKAEFISSTFSVGKYLSSIFKLGRDVMSGHDIICKS